MNGTLEMVMEALQAVMGQGRYTTGEMEVLLDNFGYRCPDDLARSLNKLRLMGAIRGEVDREKACWVWWMKDDQDE